MNQHSTQNRLAGIVLMLVIVELTVATAYTHLSLGGQLFTLNAVGYLVLAATYAATTAIPIPFIQRFGWLPRIGLAGYTVITIGAYLIMGPYFALGWIAKGIELAIVGLLVVDVLRAYRSFRGLWLAAIGSLGALRRVGA